MQPVIINSGNPVAAGSTPVYQGTFTDLTGAAISVAALITVTLTICDTLSGAIINGCDQVNILNTGRGTVNADGLLTVNLEAGDTSLSEVPGIPSIQRSLVFDWTYNSPVQTGRHQVNFEILALAGP